MINDDARTLIVKRSAYGYVLCFLMAIFISVMFGKNYGRFIILFVVPVYSLFYFITYRLICKGYNDELKKWLAFSSSSRGSFVGGMYYLSIFNLAITIAMLFSVFTSNAHSEEYESKDTNSYIDAKHNLLRCSSVYDELSISSSEYFTNGACVVDSIKVLIKSSSASIELEKEYSCSELGDFHPGLDEESLKGIASVTEFIALIESVEWIYSSHYYNYLPCRIKGSINIDDLLIKFTVNLAGPGVFYFRNKQYEFSDPKYADCFNESDC